MKKNNKGFTLLEAIIVVAIMGIVLVSVGLGINVIFSNKAKSVSRDIYNMIGTAQTMGMSKDNVYFYLSCKDGNMETGIATEKGGKINKIESDSLSSKVSVKMWVSASGGGTDRVLTDGAGVLIGFNRSTGAFKGCYAYAGGDTKGAALPNITNIRINQGSTEFKIILSYTNGKFYYEYT